MNLIESIIGGIFLLLFGSLEYRMRKVREDVNKKADRHEVAELIDLKQEAIKVTAEDTKEDIARLEKKIDKLIELQIKKD